MDDFVVIVVVKWCSYELVLKNIDDFVVDFVHSICDDLGNMQIAKKQWKKKKKTFSPAKDGGATNLVISTIFSPKFKVPICIPGLKKVANRN